MSKNAKIYLIWFLLNVWYLLGIVFYIKISYRKEYLCCFVIGISFLLLHYIFVSWIKNICRCLFWVIRKYKILIFRVVPFCFDYTSGKLKVRFDCGAFDFGNVYTYPKLASKNIQKYIEDSEKIAKWERKGHIILILIGSCVIGIFKWEIAILTLVLGVSTYIFLNVESDMVFMGSLYDSLEKETLRFECFYGMVLEDFDKSILYEKYNKLVIPSKKMSVREKRIVEGMLIDSIVDKKNYISEQWFEALFDIFSDRTLRYVNVYNRLLFLFPLYCENFKKKEEDRVRDLVDGQFYYLKMNCPSWALRKIEQLKEGVYYEILDFRNNSEVYRKKIKYIEELIRAHEA